VEGIRRTARGSRDWKQEARKWTRRGLFYSGTQEFNLSHDSLHGVPPRDLYSQQSKSPHGTRANYWAGTWACNDARPTISHQWMT